MRLKAHNLPKLLYKVRKGKEDWGEIIICLKCNQTCKKFPWELCSYKDYG